MRNLRLRIYLSVKRVGLIYLSVKKKIIYLGHIFFFFFGSTTDVGQDLPVPTSGLGFQ